MYSIKANKKFWLDKIHECGFEATKNLFNQIAHLPQFVFQFQSNNHVTYLNLSGQLVGSIYYISDEKRYHAAVNLGSLTVLLEDKFDSLNDAIFSVENEMMKSGWEIIGVNTLSDEEIIDDPILKEMFTSNLETSEQFQHEKQSDNSLEDFTKRF